MIKAYKLYQGTDYDGLIFSVSNLNFNQILRDIIKKAHLIESFCMKLYEEIVCILIILKIGL